MPPATLNAFRDHGEVRGATPLENDDQARSQLDKLAELGIDLDRITEQLQTDGLKKFKEPFDAFFEALEEKRKDAQRQRVSRR